MRWQWAGVLVVVMGCAKPDSGQSLKITAVDGSIPEGSTPEKPQVVCEPALPACANGESVVEENGVFRCTSCDEGNVGREVCFDGKKLLACVGDRIFANGAWNCGSCSTFDAGPPDGSVPDGGTIDGATDGSTPDGSTAFTCPGNLLTNPSFESPVLAPGGSGAIPNWGASSPNPLQMLFPTSGLPQTQPLAAPADGHQVLFVAPNNSFGNTNTNVSAVTGKTYTLTLVTTKPTTGTGAGRLFVELGAGHPVASEKKSLVVLPAEFVTAGVWITKAVSLTVTASGNGKPLALVIGNDFSTGSDVYVDSLCLTSD